MKPTAQEWLRRQSLEDRLYRFILSHPRRWLSWRELANHGGSAWRSRLPKIRARLREHEMEFPWNERPGDASAYMLRQKSLGPTAETYREARLF